MTLSNQRAIILGGSSGVGLATAQALAAAGAAVVVAGRDAEKVRDATAGISGDVRGESVDASDTGRLKEFFAHVGEFDHLVLSLSGAKGGGPFRELDLGALRAGFEAKFWLHVNAAQAALATLRPGGSITFVTAISARFASPGTAGLAAINGALERMVPTLAVELKPLRVNAVSPGVIDTAWWHHVPEAQRRAIFEQSAAQAAVGRIGRPEDVADAILFLLGNTFITGSIIECDGGFRL